LATSLKDYAQQTLFESKPIGYLEIHQKRFEKLRDLPISLLELGVAKGKSMAMWKEFFPNATIAGIDLLPEWESDDPRVRVYRGGQNDMELLDKVARECAPDGFDIIIDDAAHIGELVKSSFWHLFDNHLKPGGTYAIEDWGTGYWGNHVYYPDGACYKRREDNGYLYWLAKKVISAAPVEWPKLGLLGKLLRRYQYTRTFHSHMNGIPGFIKQLVDEVAISDITNPEHGVANGAMGPSRATKFRDLLIVPGVVVVQKA